jgi:hypothetical protein
MRVIWRENAEVEERFDVSQSKIFYCTSLSPLLIAYLVVHAYIQYIMLNKPLQTA